MAVLWVDVDAVSWVDICWTLHFDDIFHVFEKDCLDAVLDRVMIFRVPYALKLCFLIRYLATWVAKHPQVGYLGIFGATSLVACTVLKIVRGAVWSS